MAEHTSYELQRLLEGQGYEDAKADHTPEGPSRSNTHYIRGYDRGFMELYGLSWTDGEES